MVCTNSTCLNGGICVGGVVCACPPGWQNDFVGYYHSQNCSLPSNFVFIFFIVCSVIVPICIGALHYIARNAKKSVRDWKIFYIVWLIVDWAAVLTVFVEDGYYVAACVSTSVYAWVGSVVPAFIMMKILESYFKLVPSFPRKVFKIAVGSIVIGWNILITGIMIAAAVVVRSDVELYNTLIVAWFIIHGLLNVLFLTVFFVFTNKLKQQIESVVSAMQDHEANSRKEATLHAVKRLGGITQMTIGLLPFCFVNIAVGLALIVLDSVPYLWILWMFWMTGPIQNLPSAVPLFREFSNMKSDSSSKHNSKLNSRLQTGANDTLVSNPNPPTTFHGNSMVSSEVVPGI